MCGEKLVQHLLPTVEQGSPPHVRGKVAAVADTVTVGQDHPRMCGEKCHAAAQLCGFEGSPPHVRGKVKEWAKN